jgi:hypothetical protein
MRSMIALETIKNVPEENDSVLVPDSYFEVYREANLRFPQAMIGITTLVAATAVMDPDFDPEAFALSKWSDEQLAMLVRDMDRAHAGRNIPVRSERSVKESSTDTYNAAQKPQVVPDDRLRGLWEEFKESVLYSLACASGAVTEPRSPGLTSEIIARDLARVFMDPSIRSRTREIFSSFERTLRGERATEIAKMIRVEANRNKDAMDDLYRQLFDLMVDEYEARVEKLTPLEHDLLSSYVVAPKS